MKKIFCCECGKKVPVRLTNGSEIYPSRRDLHALPFWICDKCRNYVGCHHKTKDRTKPLGVIPSKKIREARIHIHNEMDILWKSKKLSRTELYEIISNIVGYEYHTAKLKDIEEARRVYLIVSRLRKGFSLGDKNA